MTFSYLSYQGKCIFPDGINRRIRQAIENHQRGLNLANSLTYRLFEPAVAAEAKIDNLNTQTVWK